MIGSALAFRIWSQFHSLPGVLAGGVCVPPQSTASAEVHAVLAGGPNVFPLVVPPGFTVPSWRRAGRPAARPRPRPPSTAWPPAAACGRRGSRPASTSLEGLLGTGTYVVLPGETDRQLLRRWSTGSTPRPPEVGLAAGAAQLGLTPYQVITVASIVEKEGVIAKNMGPVARVIFNRLAAGHAPADGLDRALRRGPGRRPGDRSRPGHGDARTTPTSTRGSPRRRSASRPRRRWRPPWTRRPDRGSTSWWSSRTAPRRSPTPSPDSRPTRRWPPTRGLG